MCLVSHKLVYLTLKNEGCPHSCVYGIETKYNIYFFLITNLCRNAMFGHCILLTLAAVIILCNWGLLAAPGCLVCRWMLKPSPQCQTGETGELPEAPFRSVGATKPADVSTSMKLTKAIAKWLNAPLTHPAPDRRGKQLLTHTGGIWNREGTQI